MASEGRVEEALESLEFADEVGEGLPGLGDADGVEELAVVAGEPPPPESVGVFGESEEGGAAHPVAVGLEGVGVILAGGAEGGGLLVVEAVDEEGDG